MANSYIFMSCLLAVASFSCVYGVRFVATDLSVGTPGGMRFQKEVGLPYVKETMKKSTNFIWNFFEQPNIEDRQNVTRVNLFIEKWIEGAAGETSGNTINISAVYINDCQCDIKYDMTGLIYHEMTHVWQWFGAGKTPEGLIEGIAEYVRLQAHYSASPWPNPGAGNRWDEGYQITARFLEYCDSLKKGFVPALNKKMRDDFDVGYFKELLGKTVENLWSDYKAKYGNQTSVENYSNHKMLY